MASTIDDNIAKLFDVANSALSDARSVSGRISSFYPNIDAAVLNYSLQKPDIRQPMELNNFLSDDNSSSTLQFLNAETEELIDKYFPEINACLRSSPEEWLCGIITGQKPFGLSQEVFEAVWHQARDRETRSRAAAVDQIRAEFTSRGFSMPPGAMLSAITRAEEQASDAVAEVNRAQAVRDSEIKLDLLRFAEDGAIRLKMGIFQAIGDLYRVLLDLPSKDIEASRMKVAAYGSFNDAVSRIYGVQLGFEELRLQAENLRMNGKLDETRLRIGALDGSRNTAMSQATQAFANIAASAAGAAGTMQADIISGGR